MEEKPSITGGMLAEFWGSLIFVFASAGAGAIQPLLTSPDSVLFGLTSGFGLMAAIWIASQIRGGGHINPVVTIMLYLYSWLDSWLEFEGEGKVGKLSWLKNNWFYIPYYLLLWIVAQLAGALVASLLLLAIFGTGNNLGSPVIGPGFSRDTALAYEIIGSTILFFVYLYIIWRLPQKTFKRWAAIPIGFTYLILASIGAFISSASFNWWRHLGPISISNTFNKNIDWIWYVGPLVGAGIAIILFIGFWFLTSGIKEEKKKSKEKEEMINENYYESNSNLKTKKKIKRKSNNVNVDVDELAKNLF